MKNVLKKSLCVLLSALMIFSAASVAFAVDYPAGVTKELCEESSVKTDKLVKNAVNAFSGKPLKEMINTELYKDETLSSLLTGIYSSLSESASVLKVLGIDVSPSALSNALSAYPDVSKKLGEASDWAGADLSGAKWNISTRDSFCDAVGAIFSPFNDVLYMLLCSGSYKAGIINIPGDDGYEKGLVAMLEALGCTDIAAPDVFKYEAYYNRNKMMSLIVKALLSSVDEILASPSEKLCVMVPGLADYIKNGGLEESVNALLRPLTIHIGDYIQFFTGSQMISFLMFIQDPGKYTLQFSENITLVMNDMLESSEIKLPEIDLDALISCREDKGGAYRLIMTWLIDAVKLNTDKVKEMLPEEEGTEEILKIAENLLGKDTDELFSFLVSLFTAKEGKALEYEWQHHDYTKTQAQYTEEIGEEEAQRVLDGIDETISAFIVEMAGGESLSDTVRNLVYSNSLVTTLAKGLYGALSGEETKMIAQVLSLPTSPYSLSLYIKEGALYSAKSSLSKYSKWENVDNISWGFKDGDRAGFERALTAVLRPLRPVLEAFLANSAVELFESINIGGSNGYNTAVIPLLEALGCPKKSIKTYKQYLKGKGTDKIITDILDPVLDLVDKIAKRPLYNAAAIIPNIVFFIDNGSLMQCLDNLIYPLTSLLEELSIDMKSFGFDLDEIKNTDIFAKITEMLPQMTEGLGINIGNPDIKKLQGFGELTEIRSKRTLNDKRVKAEYVKADKKAVLMTVITYAVDLLGKEENSDLLSSFMSGGEGDGGMFEQYSSGIGEQMADMTTEETLAWLYKLFFRERAVEPTEEEFTETVIYVPQEKKHVSPMPFAIAALVLIGVIAYAAVRRDSIKDFFKGRKEQKNDKKQKNDKEG